VTEWVIETRDLAKVYASGWRRGNRVDALMDLNLEIGRGEIFAFLGPNGAGKTTTINLLMGFLQPTRGQVTLFGSAPSDRWVHRRIGYLPENYAFYSFLTAPKLLSFFGRLFGLPAKERRARIERLLRQLGLWEARDRKIGSYSRGMRQRLGIAQALLNEPDLLILDEPTSGFDPVGRRMVRDLLLGLKQRGATIFLSSHILSEVEVVCDRVAIINRGRLVQQGMLRDVVGSHTGYEIAFTDGNGSIVARLREMNLKVTLVQDQGQTFIGDEALAQTVIDIIRAGGGALKAFVPKTRTLEDVFLEVVGASEQAPPPSEKVEERK
jgi:ABC-2 type transport system ATP-binding protein